MVVWKGWFVRGFLKLRFQSCHLRPEPAELCLLRQKQFMHLLDVVGKVHDDGFQFQQSLLGLGRNVRFE